MARRKEEIKRASQTSCTTEGSQSSDGEDESKTEMPEQETRKVIREYVPPVPGSISREEDIVLAENEILDPHEASFRLPPRKGTADKMAEKFLKVQERKAQKELARMEKDEKNRRTDIEIATCILSEIDHEEYIQSVDITAYMKERELVVRMEEGQQVCLDETPPNASMPGYIVGQKNWGQLEVIDKTFLPMCVNNEEKHTGQMLFHIHGEDLFKRMSASTYPWSPRFRNVDQLEAFKNSYENRLDIIENEYYREEYSALEPMANEYQSLVLRIPYVLHQTNYHLLLTIIGVGMKGERTVLPKQLAGPERARMHNKIQKLATRAAHYSKTAVNLYHEEMLRDWVMLVMPHEWIDFALAVCEKTEAEDKSAAIAFIILVENLPHAGLAENQIWSEAPNLVENLRRGGIHTLTQEQEPEYSEIWPDAINVEGTKKKKKEGDQEEGETEDMAMPDFRIKTGLAGQMYARGTSREDFAAWAEGEALQNIAFLFRNMKLETRIHDAGPDPELEPPSEAEEDRHPHPILF